MTTAARQLHDTYRREARRLRARFADDPVGRYAALKGLAERVDEQARGASDRCDPDAHVARRAQTSRRLGGSADAVPAADAGTLSRDAFETLVRERVTSAVLRYSVRRDLLRRATRLGIGQFEANLIIATVQHERRHLVDAEPDDRDGGIAIPLAVVAAMQAAIAAGVWWLLG